MKQQVSSEKTRPRSSVPWFFTNDQYYLSTLGAFLYQALSIPEQCLRDNLLHFLKVNEATHLKLLQDYSIIASQSTWPVFQFPFCEYWLDSWKRMINLVIVALLGTETNGYCTQNSSTYSYYYIFYRIAKYCSTLKNLSSWENMLTKQWTQHYY